MRKAITLEPGQILPPRTEVLRSLGVPEGNVAGDRIVGLVDRAMAVLAELAAPRGLLMGISKEEFAEVYTGEGKNAPDTPLGRIYPEADRLALYAVTIGEEISRRITELFDAHDFALGAAVDAAASEGAECATRIAESTFREHLERRAQLESSVALMAFSPGYCGWHLSGQIELFGRLRPEEIGLRLNQSCLMIPLKSVSGVLVSGPKSIFEQPDDFPFCQDCRTHECRERLSHLTRPRTQSQE